MNKTEIINNLNRTFGKTKLKLKKYSPEILVVSGIVGAITSTVMACKSTTKISSVLEEPKKELDRIHECMEDEEFKNEHDYTEEDGKKDLAIVYTQTGVKLAKLYAPSVILGTLSITAILAGHNILRKRNVALAAAYTVVDKSFKDYRSRVIERFGSDLDKELKYNIKAKEIEETVVDGKGKEKKVKKTIDVVDADGISEYAKFFDEGCKGWEDDPDFNLLTVRECEKFANRKLKTNGYLFLNDVYDMLGIQRTRAGQVVGWIYDKDHPNGDNHVDFGIYNSNIEANRNCVNGYEKVILLDFNVDGNILDLI